MYRIFVSHSRRDNDAAQAVVRWLTDNEPGLKGDIFLDIDPQTGFAPGVRWKSELVRAVDSCEAVICLISSHWERSAECKTEFRLAESLHKRIFCARLDPGAQGDLVREWQFCDLFADGKGAVITVAADDGTPVELSATGLGWLLRGLREAGIGAEYFPWPPEDDPKRAPYRGWQAMEDADAAVFFGRDPQILRGLDTLRGMRTTGVEGLFVILGPSGVGKSSFLRAGVLPRLRRDRDNFLVCDIVRPERAALTGDQGLAQAIWRLRSQAGPGAPVLGEVKAACRDSDTTRLRAWLREARGDAAGNAAPPTVLLPIDQGEELFSADGGAEAATCLGLLGNLLRTGAADELPLIAVMTIRADRYESLQNAPDLLGVHTREFGDLKPMPMTEYKDVITGPANRATAAGQRLSLDAALVDQLLADATGGGDSLPLLALTLSRLYLDYGSSGKLTLANYEAMGGMQRIVEAEIDTLLAADPDERGRQLETLRSAFVPWLATIDPDTDAPSRRVARLSELPAASHQLIDAMVGRRLLVKDERDGETVVEVALESLLRQWDSLAAWLREQAVSLKLADSLDRAVVDWERNGRSREWLFEGVRLAAAERLAGSPIFSERLRSADDFLKASREREDAEADAEKRRQETELRNEQERRAEAEAYASTLRRRTRVLWAVLAATLAVALVAVGTSVWAVRANNEANRKQAEAEARTRDALAGRLASQVQAILVGARPGAELEVVGKALAATRISEAEGLGAPLTVLSKKPRVEKVIDAPGAVLSGDGRRVATYGPSGIQLLDTDSWKPVGEQFALEQRVMALSLDGHYAVTADRDSVLRVWDTGTRQAVGAPMSGSELYVDAVVVSPDGRRVAASDGANNLRMWDVPAGRQLGGPLKGHEGPVKALAFTGDGRRLASAGADYTVRIWNAESAAALGDPLRTGDEDQLTTVVFSPDGHTVAAGGLGANLHSEVPLWIWNADTGALVGKQASGEFKTVDDVAFNSDGTKIATGSIDAHVRVWDARSGEPIGEPVKLQEMAYRVAFAPGDQQLIVGSPETVQAVDAVSGTGLATETGGGKVARGQYALVKTTVGRRIAEFGGNTLRWLNVDTGEQIGATLESDFLRDLNKIDFTPDGHWLAVLSDDNVVRVLDTSSGQVSGHPITPADDVRTMVLSPDGQTIATGGEDNTAQLWNRQDGKPIGDPMRGHEYSVESAMFSDDSRRLYTRSADSIRVWDTDTQKLVNTVRTGAATVSMNLSPDGKRLAVADYNYIQEWDADGGKTVGPVIKGRGHAAEDLSYGGGGRYLVSIGTDHTVRFWDLTSGNQLGDAIDVNAIGNGVNVAFDGDDRRVFITSRMQPVRAADFSWIGMGGGIWQVPGPAAWADTLCDKVVANPSHEQWDSWITTDPAIGYRQVCPGKPVAG